MMYSTLQDGQANDSLNALKPLLATLEDLRIQYQSLEFNLRGAPEAEGLSYFLRRLGLCIDHKITQVYTRLQYLGHKELFTLVDISEYSTIKAKAAEVLSEEGLVQYVGESWVQLCTLVKGTATRLQQSDFGTFHCLLGMFQSLELHLECINDLAMAESLQEGIEHLARESQESKGVG